MAKGVRGAVIAEIKCDCGSQITYEGWRGFLVICRHCKRKFVVK